MGAIGPLFPTTASGNTNTVGGGVGAWTNPTNIEAADSIFATNGLANSSTTDDLIGQGFGFNVPGSATILGILLEINGLAANTLQNGDHNIRLLKAGVAAGNDKSTGANLGASATTHSYGGSSDLWGTTWTPSDINNSGFGALANYSSGPSGSSNLSIDFFRITVTFSVPSSFLVMF